MSKIKICGLRRVEDIEAVNRALPDFIGFVFAPSLRRVDMKTADVLKDKLDPRIEVVGVFVNEDMSVVSDYYKSGIIDMAQLHGDEDDEYIVRLKDNCGCRVIKAVGLGSTLPPLPVESDYLLFDKLSSQRGGAGSCFDWNVLLTNAGGPLKENKFSELRVRSALVKYDGPPFFLAGGLTLENVCDSIRLLTPFCVDVSSGVETNGVKDAKKIERFVNLVRRVN